MPYKDLEAQRKRKRAYARDRRAADPTYGKAAHLKHKYGLQLEDYEAMYAAHPGCRICLRPLELYPSKPSQEDRACVDHCHTTGVVRGLLCVACNTGIGMFRDDPDIMSRAIEYLKEIPNGIR